MDSRRVARNLIALLATAASVLALGTSARADAVKDAIKCKAAIIKAAAGFVQAKAKALQRCEEAKLKAKLPRATVCRDEPRKTVPAIMKARTKLSRTIVKSCAGKDKTCGTPDPDGSEPSLATIGWDIVQCPNFESGSCTNPIHDCNDIPTCIECISQAAIDQAVGLYYDALVPSAPTSKDKAEKALNKCRVTLGKAATKFLVAKSKSLAKCWSAVNKAGSGQCPDGVAAAAIGAADSKKQIAIKKACQGPDKLFGTGDDLTRADIGFVDPCLGAAVPGGASCAHAVDTLGDVTACVHCVTEFKTDCADRAAVPAFTPYPADCNAGTCSLTLQPTSSS